MLKKTNGQVNSQAYASIIGSCSKVDRLDLALMYYKMCRKHHAGDNPPSLLAVMLVINGKLGKVEQMEKMYRIATEKRILDRYNSSVLTAGLMSGYGWAGQWKKVMLLWERLFETGKVSREPVKKHFPSKDSFSTLSMVQIQRKFGVTPVMLSIAIDALANAKKHPRVVNLWDSVIKANFPFSLNCLTSLVEAHCRCDRWRLGLKVIIDMEEDWRTKPDMKTIRNFLSLIPAEHFTDAKAALIEKYPDLLFIQSIHPTALVSRKRVFIQDQIGLTADQLTLKMKIAGGVLLLPPSPDNLDIE